MNRDNDTSPIILVVEDVHETRDGIEKLLKADGYCVALARDAPDAIESAHLRHPDLILVSLAGIPQEVIVTARHIRERAEVGDQVPIVVFCVEEIGEGDEIGLGGNVYVTRPDNFNQLRSLLARLLAMRCENRCGPTVRARGRLDLGLSPAASAQLLFDKSN
jgi:CheY-like chemotaxis protein